MPGAPQEPSGVDDELDEGLQSTVDARGSITSDPFLAEVARIPERSRPPPTGPMPRPGDTLGRFTLLSELGRGGMGVVYAAQDRTLGREVALKVLPAADEEKRRRFLHEARSAAALSDSGIATVYDVGEIEGRVFIAMELVRGRTLRAVLEERPRGAPAREGRHRGDRALPIGEALRIAREIARALAEAHAQGVVHRDLKPENVMISESGQAKLLDFGLAKHAPVHGGTTPTGDAAFATGAVFATSVPLASAAPAAGGAVAVGAGAVVAVSAGGAGGAPATEAGRILGTPGYMSPEQARGHAVDARSDVFSFGVMLYELCTGVRPGGASAARHLSVGLDGAEPEPPSRENPRVPPALDQIVLRCLRRDPAARYADAGAVLADLQRCRERRPRARALAAGVLGAAALLALLVGTRLPRWSRSPPAAGPDGSLLPSSTSAPALAAYREGLAALRAGNDYETPFKQAIELDPGFGAAHVQLAADCLCTEEESTREHLRKAQELRAGLSSRDRDLLDAVEPVVGRQPSDWAESKRRLAALCQRYPEDARYWRLLAVAAANYDDFGEAARHAAHAAELDPGFSAALYYEALSLAYLGRFQEATAIVDRCLAENPGAQHCLGMRVHLLDDRGACEDVEATARQMIASSTDPRWGYAVLANALAARGQPSATVREAVRLAHEDLRSLPLAAEHESRKSSIAGIAKEAAFEGDFVTAERRAREYVATVASSRRQSAHGAGDRFRAAILEETGRPREAALVAMDFLDRRDAWEPDPSAEDMALAHDATPALLRVASEAGLLPRPELAARREAWLHGWTARVTPVSRNFLWMYAFARPAETRADAEAALAALPDYAPIPPFRPETMVEVDVGRTYLLAGRAGEALPWLEHAARSCMVLDYPFEHVQALQLLGQAREALGDTPSACRAYRAVVSRWGQATPRSVTAEKAAERLAALRCGP